MLMLLKSTNYDCGCFQSQEEARTKTPDNDDKYKKLSPTNKWMSDWFKGKCLQNSLWCS